MNPIQSKCARRLPRWDSIRIASGFALVVAAAGCGTGTAKIVSASDVANCKPLGEVTANVASPSPDDRAAALRSAATEKGATDVVSEDASTPGQARGLTYDCGYDRNGKPPSRSEQRAGF